MLLLLLKGWRATTFIKIFNFLYLQLCTLIKLYLFLNLYMYELNLQNLEEDEEFQQALKTSHGQRPGVVCISNSTMA